MMEEVRCCSIASNFGEMRVQVTCPMNNFMNTIGSGSGSSRSTSSSSGGGDNKNNDVGENGIRNLWKEDLLKCYSGDVEKYIGEGGGGGGGGSGKSSKSSKSTASSSKRDTFVELNGGELELELKRKCVERSESWRDERID